MKRSPFYLLPLLLLLSAGCSHPNAGRPKATVAPRQQFPTLTEVPQYVRDYLAVMEGGKFRMADRGEAWSAGCCRMPGQPDKQFIGASLNADTFRLRYWQGGFAAMQQELLLIVRDEKVQQQYMEAARPTYGKGPTSHEL